MSSRSLLLSILASTALIVAAACIWFEFTPVASVMDPRMPALVSGSLSLVFFALARSSKLRKPGIVAAAVSVASALTLLFAVYDERQVQFPGGGGIALSGTLVLPRWSEKPHPAVVFIHGSGREDRWEFGWHARTFARHGVAALMYDKRGVGKSAGETYESTYEAYAADAAGAIHYLRTLEAIAANCVGIYGHSEGGWVASIVAGSLIPDVRFVVVTSTTSLSPAAQVLYETGSSVRAAGFDAETVDRALDLQRRTLSYQRSGEHDERLARDLATAAAEPWFDPAELPTELYPIEEYRWWRGVMDFDAIEHWQRVRAPVLAISGGRDLNSDVEVSQREIAAALRAGGNEDFTGRIYSEMEHGGIEWWLPGRLPPPRFPSGFAAQLMDWVGLQTTCDLE